MNLDWTRLKAVVLESDDWGLCAWSPDEQAYRVLADAPAFRTDTGRRYAGSTLESADDVRQLGATLLEFRGGDGFPPAWQANTIVAAPDYSKLLPPLFPAEELPLLELPVLPSRWKRPGMWDEVARARESGVWWPELHGLHHIPERAWITALRRGVSDARRAHEHESPVCLAVEASGEYDPSEPRDVRRRNLQRSVEVFTRLFGRPPGSLCPPDYRWDEDLEADAETAGVTTFQGHGEQHGHKFPRLRRTMLRWRWPTASGKRFYMPPRIAFEPSNVERIGQNSLIDHTHRTVRNSWRRAQPAVVSSHRLNYAHLEGERSARGRGMLRDLLKRMVEDGAVFLVDAEVRQLHDRNWSVREIGKRGALVRYHGVPRDPIRFAAPNGTRSATLRESRGPDDADVKLDGGQVTARLNVGEYLVEWGT